MSKIIPFFWFDGHAEEAARFYTSIFKNSRIESVSPMSTSILVNCETQAEVGNFWDKRAAGGTKQQCGWLRNKFNVLLTDHSLHPAQAAAG